MPPPPAETHVGPRDLRPFAQGRDDGWSLAQGPRGLVLSRPGSAPVRLGAGVWSATPRGRRLTAVAEDGRTLTLDVAHSVDGGAVLAFDGARLPGRLLATGERPYPGG